MQQQQLELADDETDDDAAHVRVKIYDDDDDACRRLFLWQCVA